ncbi:GNAT family N-acetyltransferase [Sphingomonas sp. A2-49]|uniref:GNAT family N-acetyltransferase n=1 Tax=Sphingomonas sp. A2-49 TaxID=1391375 RepID=UPI0021D012C7|nr:GNAT family N-acetyltransferase [Sphingomonas sp. A2-49]MCU6453649.1 GNAT family N-acetyltransferase [Sphingomonas sp. A2-49]
MSGTAVPFRIGARTLLSVRRDLVRVALSLDAALAGHVPPLPPAGGDGYLVTSLPASRLGEVDAAGRLIAVRQRYMRYHADLTIGHDRWHAGLSRSARATLARKCRRAAAAGVEIRAYRTPQELGAFHPIAQAVSATTYQARLLDAGWPCDAVSLAGLHALAAADGLRAWALLVRGAPAAYLCCTAEGATLRYEHVGHDPAFGALSPGVVLQAAAMRALFKDRFACLDFTEGEGQHKRLFATASVACADLLVLRPTMSNRVLLAALAAFDGGVAAAKRATRHPRLAPLTRRLRR